MSLPRPSKNCPYCGGFNLTPKQWRSRGTWFVACNDCKGTGPSMARDPQEACDLFDRRATPMERVRTGTIFELMEQPGEVR